MRSFVVYRNCVLCLNFVIDIKTSRIKRTLKTVACRVIAIYWMNITIIRHSSTFDEICRPKNTLYVCSGRRHPVQIGHFKCAKGFKHNKPLCYSCYALAMNGAHLFVMCVMCCLTGTKVEVQASTPSLRVAWTNNKTVLREPNKKQHVHNNYNGRDMRDAESQAPRWEDKTHKKIGQKGISCPRVHTKFNSFES